MHVARFQRWGKRDRKLSRRNIRALADSLPRLAREVWRSSPWLAVLILLLSIGEGLLQTAPIAVNQRLVDRAAAAVRSGLLDGAALAAALGSIGWVLALYLLVAMTQHVLRLVQGLIQNALGRRVTFRMHGALLEKAQQLDYSLFEHPKYYDDLRRAQVEVGFRALGLLRILLRISASVVGLLAILTLLGSAHWGLPGLLALAAIPGALVYFRFGELRYWMLARRTAEGRKALYFSDLLTQREAAKEVRLFQLARYLLTEWGALTRKAHDEDARLELRRGLAALAAELARLAAYGAAYLLLAWQLLHGEVSLGRFVAFAAAIPAAQGQLDAVFQGLSQVFEEALFASDFFAFMALPVATPASTAATGPAFSLAPAGIRCEELAFTYPGGQRPAVAGVNLLIRPGEHVAIVGENGAGKTTLVKLISGLYTPTAGRLFLGGTAAADVDPEALRARVAVLFQDFVHYWLTARENIGFGHLPDMAAAEQVVGAAVRSGADAFLSRLPRAYETPLTPAFEGGVELSAGQWQKVALARAFLRPAELLILDEPSANLDPRAEAELFAAFRDLAAGKTAIFISHRVGFARLADRILVMQGGQIIEQGSHDELMAQDGAYAGLFRLQAQGYQ